MIAILWLLAWSSTWRDRGGNVTCVYSLQQDLIGNRLELLKEMLPGLKRGSRSCDAPTRSPDGLEAAARRAGAELHRIEVRWPEDLGVLSRPRKGVLTQ